MADNSKQPNGMPWSTFDLDIDGTVAAIKAQRELIAERSQPYGYYYNHIFVGDYHDRELLVKLERWLDYLHEENLKRLHEVRDGLNAESLVMQNNIDRLNQIAAE